MRRTKQWWAGLTKEERSELHCLDYGMSSWIHRHQIESNKCNFCQKPWHKFGICPKCAARQNQLIKKANEVAQCNPR